MPPWPRLPMSWYFPKETLTLARAGAYSLFDERRDPPDPIFVRAGSAAHRTRGRRVPRATTSRHRLYSSRPVDHQAVGAQNGAMTCCHGYALVDGGDAAFTIDASQITFGPGALAEAGDVARSLGGRRVPLFSDRTV